MAPYLRSTVDGVLPARRLSSLHLAHSVAKQARVSRGAAVAAGATSHHRIRQRATCACVRDGSTERTEPSARRGAARAGAAEGRPRPPAAPRTARPPARALHRHPTARPPTPPRPRTPIINT
ncbi:unnamed protein product, partial [Iphiclides podalirius]